MTRLKRVPSLPYPDNIESDSGLRGYVKRLYHAVQEHLMLRPRDFDIKLDDWLTPDDNTDLNASTTAHGLLPKLDNNSDHYLDGQGNWESLSSLGDPTTIGTLTIGSGSITDSSGAIDFGNENLSTTGTLGVGTASPDNTLHVYHATDNALALLESGDQYANLGFKDSGTGTNPAIGADGDDIRILTGGAVGIRVDSLGFVTMPLQPAFCVYLSANQTNIAVGTTWVDVQFNTERFDQNADFNTGTYTFTAPVTGKYLLTINLRLEDIDTAAAIFQSRIYTSNDTYTWTKDPNFSADLDVDTASISVVVDMDVSDTATAKVRQTTGTQQLDVSADSWFTGCLLA